MAEVEQRATASRSVAIQPALARVAAQRARAIRFADIPAEVVALAKIHFLDQLGVGLAAATLPRNANWLRSHPRSEQGAIRRPSALQPR